MVRICVCIFVNLPVCEEILCLGRNWDGYVCVANQSDISSFNVCYITLIEYMTGLIYIGLYKIGKNNKEGFRYLALSKQSLQFVLMGSMRQSYMAGNLVILELDKVLLLVWQLLRCMYDVVLPIHLQIINRHLYKRITASNPKSVTKKHLPSLFR